MVTMNEIKMKKLKWNKNDIFFQKQINATVKECDSNGIIVPMVMLMI
jgi:hypothetical protein